MSNLEKWAEQHGELSHFNKRDDFKKCKMCDREFAMAHNEDEDNAAEMECIEEHGRCLECYEEYGEDGYADR